MCPEEKKRAGEPYVGIKPNGKPSKGTMGLKNRGGAKSAKG